MPSALGHIADEHYDTGNEPVLIPRWMDDLKSFRVIIRENLFTFGVIATDWFVHSFCA